MNKLNAPLIILTILLSFSACKKDVKVKPEDSPTILSCDLNTPTFSRDINTTDTYYDLVEDMGRNIVILGKNHVLKYDYQGNVVWSKNIPSVGKPQNIIQADGDNYFTTNSTIDITSQNPYQFYTDNEARKGISIRLTAYWRSYPSYPLPNCSIPYDKVIKNFGEEPDSFVYAEKPVNRSKCFLNKLDKDGNLLWTKTFDGNYFLGKNVCKTGDGYFALATLKISGGYRTVKFDQNGMFQDTIDSPIDQNSITIYKLDKDGSIIWTKTINGILVAGYTPEEYLEYLNIHIVSLQNNLLIQTPTKLFVVDENGNVIRSMKPNGTDCDGIVWGLSSYNNLVYSTGRLSSYRFALAYDANGNIREQTVGTNMPGGANTLAMSDGIIFTSQQGFSKTDKNGSTLWSAEADGDVTCANRTCKDGIVYVTDKKGKLKFFKTDRNGFY